jgi:hypothetical protein
MISKAPVQSLFASTFDGYTSSSLSTSMVRVHATTTARKKSPDGMSYPRFMVEANNPGATDGVEMVSVAALCVA